MKNLKPKFLIVLSAILLASIFRLVPHWPNFTPIATIAIMGGALIGNRLLAVIIPILAMMFSDLLTIVFINYKYTTVADYFSSPATLLIYLAILGISTMGFWLRDKQSSRNLALVSLHSALLFFVVSNFGVWLTGSLPKTFAGLLATYDLGIPFFGYNLAGNLFYTFLFFGAFHWSALKWPALIKN
jgi:hypothetical protein